MAGHVFISHSRADAAYASRLTEHLCALGVPVSDGGTMAWVSDDYGPDTRADIDACSVVVALLTPASVSSERVRQEIAYAIETRKPVRPLLLAFCQIPLALASLGYDDVLTGQLPSGDFLSQLLALASAPGRRGDRLPNPVADSTPHVVLRGHTDSVAGVAIAPDGRWLASASFDGTVRLWAADGSQHRTLPGHAAGATGVAIAPDGTWLATSGDRTVATWEVSGRVRGKLAGHSLAVWAVAISPDGSYVASAGIDRTVRLWPMPGGPPTVLDGHSDAVMTVAIGPGGSWLATAGTDATVRLWHRTGEPMASLPQPGAVSSVAIAPNGQWFVAAAGGAAWVWHSDGTFYRILEDADRVRAVAIAPTGSIVAAGCDDGAIRLWRMGQGPDATLVGHADVVQAVAIAPSSTWLASASNDRTVRLWHL